MNRAYFRTASRPILVAVLLGAAVAVSSAEPRDFELLWHRSLADPIYTTTGISAQAGLVFAGDWWAQPLEVEAIPLLGDGTPAWVRAGSELYVDASRDAGVLAGLDATAGDSTVYIREWAPGSSVPLWSYPVHPCRPLTAEGWSAGKGIEVSDDGSTIAAVVNMYTPGSLKGRLFLFDPGSGAPVVEYPLDGTASALAITADGHFVAVYAWPYIYVYDRVERTLRWSGGAVSGNDALAISGDGQYVAWGWSTLYLRRWDGSTYQLLWAGTKSGYYVTECALTRDESALAVGWYDAVNQADNVVELYTLPAHELVWSYDYAQGRVPTQGGERNPVEVISEMVWSQDDQILAAASWGGTYPEVHAFARSSPVPVLVYDTPGTMFDIDVALMNGDAYVAACGKHVHVGQSGRGADLYLFRIPGASGVAEETASPELRLSCPSPVRAAESVRLAFEIPRPGPATLTLHDAGGRMVARVLDTALGAGSHTARWNGLDEAGRAVAPGVYFARLASGGGLACGRIIVIR